MRTDSALVVLTRYDARFGEKFLHALAQAGVKPALIVVAHTPFSKRWKMCKFLARKIGWIDALRYNLKFWRVLLLRKVSGGRLHCTPDFTQFDAPLLHCSDVNDAHVITALSNPHYRTIILAQSGIVREGLLALPDKWIVNAHPGKLPEFRGVDVVKWALWHKAPVEVTLHIVRKGVDTGEVLKALPVAVQATDSIGNVEGRATEISIQLLLEAAMKGKEGFGEPQKQPKSTGNQYYLMPSASCAAYAHSGRRYE
jgi:hypothetical protein